MESRAKSYILLIINIKLFLIMEHFRNEVFPHFDKKFNLIIDSVSEDGIVVMRAAIKDDSEATAFINQYKALTNTGWIYYYARNNPTK